MAVVAANHWVSESRTESEHNDRKMNDSKAVKSGGKSWRQTHRREDGSIEWEGLRHSKTWHGVRLCRARVYIYTEGVCIYTEGCKHVFTWKQTRRSHGKGDEQERGRRPWDTKCPSWSQLRESSGSGREQLHTTTRWRTFECRVTLTTNQDWTAQ